MSDHINSSKIQSVDIEAQNYTINGEDIGKGILPKLVHRVSLHPVYDEETDSIVENQYFTLHNDAGDLLYTSKFIQGDSTFQTVVTPGGNTGGGGSGEGGGGSGEDGPGGDEPDDPPIPPPVPPKPYPPRPRPIPDGIPVPVPDDEDEEEWVWLPVVIPSGPWGPSRPRRHRTGRPRTVRVNPKPKPEVEEEEDEDPYIRYIDGKYRNKAIESIPSQSQRDWDNEKVFSAQMTFEGTHIKYNNHPWSELRKGNRMFCNCSRLRQMQGKTRFRKLVEADQMFENCPSFLGFIIPEGSSAYGEYGDRLDLSKLKTAKRMFAECPQLTDVKLYLPRLENASAMFLNNKNLGVVDIDYKGNAPKCTTAVSMYEGTAFLKHLKPKSVFQNSLITADYMFWQSAIQEMPVDVMPAVTSAKGMFYACGFTKLECRFPSLKDATSMFQGSGMKEIDLSKYPNVEIGKQMFALCDLSESTISIDLEKLADGTNMFRNTELTKVTKFRAPSLQKAGGFFGGCKLDKESAMIVFDGTPDAVRDITKGSEYYMNIGIAANLMGDSELRAHLHLPEEIPPTAASQGEFAYLNDAKTRGVAIFWN